ncbi:hypothetical protein DERP_003668 [Dermatophagoides pteronyssinus]|uniref:Uncharacterized protein n=1 Tax=Dermatophagoides pteronyssinus TaxID=6956 RepID=A0ABQ8JLE0_DERPT|nr:hypothetical protein DERP_003668 [Dermatophagoides pteronyssinus]
MTPTPCRCPVIVGPVLLNVSMNIGSARIFSIFHFSANLDDTNDELAPSSNTTRTVSPFISVTRVLCMLRPFCISNDG